MMVGLKPCPFCSDPMLIDDGVFKHLHQTASCPIRQNAWQESYLPAWNTRIQSTADLQAKLDKAVEALENIRDIEKPMFGEQPERDWLAWYSTASQMAELADDALITAKSERDE